ncbi:alpha-amylase family glycosyl hydrolase [Chryseolinea lacunae]|uniref:Alpha-amylase n=1 Tax=Chryseolinea lacunae TaxID=2801331 RepID=A0ABS1KW05_9BACT|nr:alpha-amylase family glycosyl hydrolase [Chryseolinea lacunae]MBL0743654.1 alpha-amylase [Chryseolinea lacunae]
MFARFTCVALFCSWALWSCKPPEVNVATWPQGVKYEVFVLSFADGNGDGKGDLKGLTAKLDYLQDLGVNGIWLMPIMNAPSYHKYDVMDYKSIHADYGTPEDFRAFIAEAHRHGIKVIIDLILNHTGTEHPWFKGATQGKNNPYRHYYVWAKKDSIRTQMAKKTTSFDSDNITQWHPVNGDTQAEHYYGYFWAGMPDLNFDNPRVKQEFMEIGKFWLSDMQVDGFRLDAARHIFPTDRAADNHAFWQEFRQAMQYLKPDVYLVGEVWADAKEVAPYLKGLPSLFNFDMGYAITDVVNAGRDTMKLIERYKRISDYYRASTPEYTDAIFLKNHDQNRILSELGGDPGKMRVAAGILMTLPGTPYVYYGEEIGMLGKKPDEYIREPFVWATDDKAKENLQTSWEQPRYSTAQTVTPASLQQNDPASLYNAYRNLIHFRNSSKALTFGTIDPSGVNVAEVVSFKRTHEGETVLVLHNVSDVEVTVTLENSNAAFNTIVFDSNGTTKLNNGELTLPAYATVILKPKQA